MQQQARPWYREPYVWFIVFFPALAVFAGSITIYLAIKSDDGLVADDYYKEGLKINKSLERDRAALGHGLKGFMQANPEQRLVRVQLETTTAYQFPEEVTLKLLHSTRSGHDQILVLKAIAPRLYQGQYEQDLVPGTWHGHLEADDWRLIGLMKHNSTEVEFTPVLPGRT